MLIGWQKSPTIFSCGALFSLLGVYLCYTDLHPPPAKLLEEPQVNAEFPWLLLAIYLHFYKCQILFVCACVHRELLKMNRFIKDMQEKY